MRYVMWIVKAALFVLVLSFAVKNTDTVTVRYYLGAEWQGPLVFVMLVAFCAGVAFGIIACLPQIFRLRRENARLKNASRESESNRRDAETQRRLNSELQG